MQNIIQYLIDRANERSTWLGIISMATALGFVLDTAQQDAIVAAGMAAAGVVAAFTKDKA